MDKKNEEIDVENSEVFELDELYWFIQRKPRTETRENVYLMTMVNRLPRQIVGFDVAYDKSSERIQAMVDTASPANRYTSDGWSGYMDVIYPGKYIRNTHDKSDTFTVEGVNADLRHYIPILARRSRCFARTLETFKAVVQGSPMLTTALGMPSIVIVSAKTRADCLLLWSISFEQRCGTLL